MRQSVVRRGQDTGSSWLRQNCFRELFTLIEGCWMDRFCARVFLLSLCLLIVACRCRCRRLLLVVVACCYLSLSHVLLLVGICIYLPLTLHPPLQSQQMNPNRHTNQLRSSTRSSPCPRSIARRLLPQLPDVTVRSRERRRRR